MIKINLLPFRAARQKENIRQQVSIFSLLVLLSLAGLYLLTASIDNEIEDFKKKNTAIKAQIAEYKAKADRVKQIKKDLAILEDKLNIVETLQAERKKPVELLDRFTGLVIPERMWITQMSTTSKNVLIKGIAFDNPTIADFMNQLEDSSLFSTVNLNNSKMKKIKDGINLKEFDLTCTKATIKKPDESPEKN